MSWFRKLLLVITLAGIAGCVPPAVQQPAPSHSLPGHDLPEGWIWLFDGATPPPDGQHLFGWRAESDADWKVEEGAIVVTSGKTGLLRTTTQFDNYILKVDFRCDAGTNSGIFLRTSPQPQDPAGDCYELNIAPADNPYPTGSLVGRKTVDANFHTTDWQSFEVTVLGPRINAKLNGEQILEYTDPAPLGRGFIGLQHHSGKVAFRNIMLKPLGLEPIFNGQDLSGWKTYPEMDSKFTVGDDGTLHVEGGPGQLETEQTYADFVLQLECKTNAKHLNSGVFFRCIPGEARMGYESQIHNGFAGGDRTKPLDCGTGGIFRRADARFVAADDLEWFSKTIIAEGPHMAVWVNGRQVTDWTDTREKDENPRRGLRLAAGTIMIQGHDPTTDISFRNLRAAELAPRGR